MQLITNIVEYNVQGNDHKNLIHFKQNGSIEYISYKKYLIKFTTIVQLREEIAHKKTEVSELVEENENCAEQRSSIMETSRDLNEEILIKHRETILSTEVIQSYRFLIELFETQMQLIVYERDYSYICDMYNLKFIEYADVLVNESTGVIIHEQTFELERLMVRLNYLKYQLDFCYLIIFSFDKEKQKESLSEDKKLNLIVKLNKIESLKVKLFEVHNRDELKKIFMKIFSNNKNLKIKTSFNVEPNISEIVLLSSCCFNSFSAHLMTSKLSLDELLQLKCDRDIEAYHKNGFFSHVPLRVIKNFYQILNKSSNELVKASNEDGNICQSSQLVTDKSKKFLFQRNNQSENNSCNDLKTQAKSNYKLTYEISSVDKNQTCLVFKKLN